MILPICEVERIELELTSTCNLKCPLCFRTTHPNIIGKLKYRNKNEILSQVKEYKNLKYITIAGPTSEPTLHPEFFDILIELKKMDLEISLFINGDTHDDMFYKKLGMIFREIRGHIYFTICGSTQELHSKYRVNSILDNVVRRFKIANQFSKKAIITWIVFNYNKDDFEKKFNMFDEYESEYFYTLPVKEHFNLDIDIHLPEPQHSVYKTINKFDSNIICPAKNYKFHLISNDGSVNPCTLYKIYGKDRCFECSDGNSEILRKNKIYHIAEPESDTSEIELRL